MANLMLPSYLSQLLPSDLRIPGRFMCGIPVHSASWTELTGEMRLRFPGLATRVLTERDTLASGFALVVNDQVVHSDYASLQMSTADEIAIIVSIAGG